jgi:RES domain-containing protein
LLDGIAYRASRPEHTDLGTSAVASRKQPGRFNNEEIGALYLWRDAPTAVDEFRSAENAHADQSCVVSIVQFALIRVLDLTDHVTRESWGMEVSDFVSANMTRCREVAAAAAARGWEAIQWPSMTGRDSCLAVFLELLSPASTVQLLRVIEPPKSR